MPFNTPDQAEAAFYGAFQELDTELMAQVWSDDPDAACVHPGGDLLQGKSAVMQSWIEIFGAAERPTLVHRTLQATGNGELAVHLVEEMIRPGGKSDASRVLATNVYQRERGGWRMVAHHASLPIMAGRRREQQGRLH